VRERERERKGERARARERERKDGTHLPVWIEIFRHVTRLVFITRVSRSSEYL
jgi:hypothetical protein